MKRKPVILSHHMLYGLKAGQEKMSKSDADSAVFMEDTREDVERKIMNAYCPRFEESGDGKGDDNDEGMHLDGDRLKNPCLDYVSHIILSRPNSTFKCNGSTYTSAAAVKSDYCEGKIPEKSLKTALSDSLNEMLQPVRDHFENNQEAKDLLRKVREYNKIKPSGDVGCRRDAVRCDGRATCDVKRGSHLVFLPRATCNPTYQDVVDVLQALEMGDAGADKVLVVQDWCDAAVGSVGGNSKVVSAYYDVLLCCLRCVSSSAMKGVAVVRQSEYILKSPSDYWVSCINVGRRVTLASMQGGIRDSDGVGYVVSRIMTVADIVTFMPRTVVYLERPIGSNDPDSFASSFSLGAAAINLAMSSCSKFVTNFDGVECLEVKGRVDVKCKEGRRDDNENGEYFCNDDPKVRNRPFWERGGKERGGVCLRACVRACA